MHSPRVVRVSPPRDVVTEPAPCPAPRLGRVYWQRWAVLAIFSCVTMWECAVWNTFGPMAQTSKRVSSINTVPDSECPLCRYSAGVTRPWRSSTSGPASATPSSSSPRPGFSPAASAPASSSRPPPPSWAQPSGALHISKYLNLVN